MNIIGNISIYYINLNRSTDRNTMLLNTFKEYGITNYKRVEAFDGTLENFKDKYTTEISNKEIACSLSHWKAIEIAYNDNCDYAIIMEDDCNFEYLKYKKIPIIDMFKKIDDCEILQLQLTINSLIKCQDLRFKEDVYYKGHKEGAVAYIINRIGMEKIISKYKITLNINVSDRMLYDSVNTYFCLPYFTYYFSNKVKTTIHCTLSIYENRCKKFVDEIMLKNSLAKKKYQLLIRLKNR